MLFGIDCRYKPPIHKQLCTPVSIFRRENSIATRVPVSRFDYCLDGGSIAHMQCTSSRLYSIASGASEITSGFIRL